MLGRGRPRKRPAIVGTRVLSPADLEGLVQGREQPVKKLRDAHHRLAMMFAAGLRNHEIAAETGYTPTRISVLRRSPMMEELVEHYRALVAEGLKEGLVDYYGTMARGRNLSMQMMVDQLVDAEESGEDLPLRTLASLHEQFADRTGYGKRSTQVNVNVDFAAQLDRAIERSGLKVVNEVNGTALLPDSFPVQEVSEREGEAREVVSGASLTNGELSESVLPPTFRRRA